MKKRLKTLFIIGTRPEAIKLAPVILAMRKDQRFQPVVCATAQHREMLDQVLSLFKIRPRHDLDAMGKNHTLAYSMSTILMRLDKVVQEEKPDLVLVQGDTTSALAGCLAAFYRRVPLGHIEAGLRTHDKYQPFPEEINRRLTSQIADYHLAPTAGARENLLAEGVLPGRIVVTGNTVVDALLFVKRSIEASPAKQGRLRKRFPFVDAGAPLILVTGHRRESFGKGLRDICAAIRKIALVHPSDQIVYPVHPNPEVRMPVRKELSGIPNVHLLEPLDYEAFVYLMMRSRLILTDSGGIQEEAPSLGKPVLVMRNTTERPEALGAGGALLVGTDPRSIVEGVERVLAGGLSSSKATGRRNPFGDGRASERIVQSLGTWMAR
jgi:UDP-N-acetylglucosamine 2-epimerase (non-hydrolysing)